MQNFPCRSRSIGRSAVSESCVDGRYTWVGSGLLRFSGLILGFSGGGTHGSKLFPHPIIKCSAIDVYTTFILVFRPFKPAPIPRYPCALQAHSGRHEVPPPDE